ncbi:MAG: histidine--tRNA ligase [Saprospiraceae bacterium]|nr:histidine--tRNA ligase [Saprospiraceae bacterium]
MFNKPSLAKGTRDFLPEQSRKRKYIFQIIEECFSLFAYQPLETPAMENLSTLMGKYGDEGDKLLFKILNSGDYLNESPDQLLQSKNSQSLAPYISEKGLRYDLTVPFARAVVMNRHLIHFPFKRYQIQPVWRADRPQRGRYREFYQCDADVVGSDSLMYEAELIQIYLKVFEKLNIPVNVQINHRSILEGMAIHAGRQDLFIPMTVTLDKLDKIGEEKVIEELTNIGFDKEKSLQLISILNSNNLNDFRFNDKSNEGILSIHKIFRYCEQSGTDLSKVKFTASLARGLSYYTGSIFEVVPLGIKMGSLGGGGRYDNLTGVFGLDGVSGVGISFGADRIYDVMEELKLFPEIVKNSVDLLILALDEEVHFSAYALASRLRESGIVAEAYPDGGKLKKQFKYAEDIGAKFILVYGEEEKNSNIYKLKNQSNGEERILSEKEMMLELKHIK